MTGNFGVKLSFPAICWMSIAVMGCSSARETEFERTLTETLETIRAEDEIVGFSIGVIKDGAVVYQRGFGLADMRGDKPITPQSVFHWASVSKPFTATAIMQLSERGALDLDAPFVDLLPDYVVTDPRARKVTLRQLLLHTSGMPDLDIYDWSEARTSDEALMQWVNVDAPRDISFDPGTDRKYSNIGFDILGAVVQQVSGMPYERYMMDHILQPLGMTDATFFYPDVTQPLRTWGHNGKASEKYTTPWYPYDRRWIASGTLNAGIKDMSRFALAMLGGGTLEGATILKPETLADMWQPRWRKSEDSGKASAMGWGLEVFNGHSIVRHYGWDDGYRSALILIPQNRSAIFLATNDESTKVGKLIMATFAAMEAAP